MSLAESQAALDPSPAFAVEVAENCEATLVRLDAHEPVLRMIALMKLEGHTNGEVSAKIGKSPAITFPSYLEIIMSRLGLSLAFGLA